jgi:hypothetical protein
MDPAATLAEAQSRIGKAGEREECAEFLMHYFEWRIKGGFEPKDGDVAAFRILLALGSVADTLSEALAQK